MIIDHMGNAEWYEGLHDRFKKAFDFIRNTDLASKEAGRYEIDGENLFALVQEYDTVDFNDKFYESHKTYIDIQYIISGTEMMGHGSKANLTVTDPYNPDKDVEKYQSARLSECRLDSGFYAVFFPGDPHMPGCTIPGTESQAVKKLVLKIKM